MTNDSERKCEHNNIENNMCPAYCKDCGKLLDEALPRQPPVREMKPMGYNSHLLAERNHSPVQDGVQDAPVRKEWEDRFDRTFARPFWFEWTDEQREGLGMYSNLNVPEVKEYIRSERLAAQREIVKMILENKSSVHKKDDYVSVSDIEDIGKGLGL